MQSSSTEWWFSLFDSLGPKWTNSISICVRVCRHKSRSQIEIHPKTTADRTRFASSIRNAAARRDTRTSERRCTIKSDRRTAATRQPNSQDIRYLILFLWATLWRFAFGEINLRACKRPACALQGSLCP